jgi:hypothetical protein
MPPNSNLIAATVTCLLAVTAFAAGFLAPSRANAADTSRPAVGGATPTASPTTITFVANAENLTRPRVRYAGRAWAADPGGFLAGAGRGQRLLAEVAPGAGDFRVQFELALPRSGREIAIVLGPDSTLSLASGAQRWKLKGRFFRAGEQAVELAAPEIAPGKMFALALERRGEEITLSVDGREIHRGPCRAAPLTQLGVDPDAGVVQLYTFSATGMFPAAHAAGQAFGNPFGLQLRRVPPDAATIHAPVIVREAPTNECSVVTRRGGAIEIYFITKPESESVSVIRSHDGGLTWSEPGVVFPLPGRAYYAVKVLEAADGAMHAVFHILGQGPGGYRGRLYEVHHVRQAVGASAWSPPQRVVPGYVGSIRGFTQLAGTGRLLLGVGRAIPAREPPPVAGPDFGWNDTFVYFSDDQGATWRQSPDQLQVELTTPNVTRYGAVEPVMLGLRDDRAWMLVRDRGGRLWQSFSPDGARWPALERSPFISSDSPAELLRLRDGRILLLTNACQFWADPRTYAMGGRDVLHAAISADDGRSWQGFREILHETDVVSGGDRGTAYASAAETPQGRIVVVSGQGEGKRAIVMFDPRWLTETTARDDLDAGPVGWTQYGDDGLYVESLDGGRRAAAIPLKSSGLCGALWNFPVADRGELTLRLRVPADARAVRLCLNDHFNRNDDAQAAAHAVFALDWEKIAAGRDAGWHEVRLAWSAAARGGELTIAVDGKRAGTVTARRPAQFGVNYLRVEFRGVSDRGQVLVSELSARVLP